ncbi:MAG: DinB family protein [Pelomonas sp.]|nr:DinB family protein [Roseateles sp.]
MSTQTLKSLFDFKAWANAELFAKLEALPAEHAETRHASVRTLNHIYVVDRIFRAHLEGTPRPFDATNTKDTPTLGALRRDMLDTDAWYQAYVAELDAAELAAAIDFRFTDGDAGRMTREEMLVHVITHGGYHRGNVGQLLKGIGVAPPRELYTRFLHQSEPARRG